MPSPRINPPPYEEYAALAGDYWLCFQTTRLYTRQPQHCAKGMGVQHYFCAWHSVKRKGR